MDSSIQIENTLLEQCDHTTLANEELFEYLNGLWKGKKPPYVNVKVLRNTNFNNDGTLSLEDVAELPVEEKQFRRRKLVAGDIILERSGGGPKQPVGRVVFFDLPQEDYSFSNFTTCIRVKDWEVLNPEFLLYYLLSFYNQGNTNELQQRTTGIRNLNFSDYKKIAIPLPMIKEQTSIIFVLGKLQQVIAQQEKIIAKTKELKRSLMHRLFTYGLRGEELKETEIGLMPENWNLVSIGELIANKVLFIQNGFPCGKWNDKGIGILQLRPFNISDEGYIDLNTVKHIQTDKKIDSYLLRNEDVIFNNTNSEKLVGKTALWQAEKEAVLSNHMTIIRISKKDKLVPLYLARLLHKKWFDKYFRSICQRHVNQASVGVERIKGVRLGLPSIAEQKEIASVFYQLDQKICNENIKKMNLESFFKSMLQLLMTGQVRVKDIDFGEDYE